jgi:hypothetical protein
MRENVVKNKKVVKMLETYSSRDFYIYSYLIAADNKQHLERQIIKPHNRKQFIK